MATQIQTPKQAQQACNQGCCAGIPLPLLGMPLLLRAIPVLLLLARPELSRPLVECISPLPACDRLLPAWTKGLPQWPRPLLLCDRPLLLLDMPRLLLLLLVEPACRRLQSLWALLMATESSGVLMSWYPVSLASMEGQKGITPWFRRSAYMMAAAMTEGRQFRKVMSDSISLTKEKAEPARVWTDSWSKKLQPRRSR